MDGHELPELKQILGAMLFVRKEPLGTDEIRKVLKGAAERYGGAASGFAGATEAQVRSALEELGRDLAAGKTGFHLAEVAGGWRLENDSSCGPWLRTMLQKGRGTRLSLPALETLAIVAYRQPVARSEIEAVRGVAVDAILKNLLEMQLVKVVGRSELPGRPWLFGTTRKFMEHFGLKSLAELPGTDELRRMDDDEKRAAARRARAAAVVVEAPEEVPENPGQMKMALIEEAVPRVETEEERAAAELSAEPGDDDFEEREGGADAPSGGALGDG